MKMNRAARRRAMIALCGAVALASFAACTVSLNQDTMGKGIGAGLSGTSLAAGKGHPEIWAEPDAWVLVENPRHQPDDVYDRRDPSWIWARRDRLPVTVNRVVGGEKLILAPEEVLKKYAPDKVPPAGWTPPATPAGKEGGPK